MRIAARRRQSETAALTPSPVPSMPAQVMRMVSPSRAKRAPALASTSRAAEGPQVSIRSIRLCNRGRSGVSTRPWLSQAVVLVGWGMTRSFSLVHVEWYVEKTSTVNHGNRKNFH